MVEVVEVIWKHYPPHNIIIHVHEKIFPNVFTSNRCLLYILHILHILHKKKIIKNEIAISFPLWMIRGFSWSVGNVIFVEDFGMVILHTHPHNRIHISDIRFQSHPPLWFDISIPHLTFWKSSPQY